MRALAVLLLLAATPALAAKAPPAPFDAGVISGLSIRNIGSAAMSGRVSAIAGADDPSGKVTLFVGAASGGVWKSTDGGTTYRPVFDDQPVQSIGAIAIDPSNPKNVWVGTGEAWTRNSVSVGDGIYRSTDGGETWANVGLADSERISKIIVDPRSSDHVWACVPGKLWSDSPDRGLYQTTDGGKSWSLALKGSNLSTGCGALTMDAKDPDVIFASLWDFRRKGWTFRSGGDGPDQPSGSGLFRSADGGKTWTKVDASAGLPAEPYGRIAVAIAPSDPNRVYAAVEAVHGGLYISKDAGKTWTAGDNSQWMVWRPFYFSNLIVDPKNADIVYKTDGALVRSDDGGVSVSGVGGFGGMHGDVHDVWIDPANSQHVVSGDDGGIWYSYDGGNRWWKGENLPISQFYHVSLDNDDPYHVYGGLQDNSSWVGDSAYPGGIGNAQWENMYGGDGFWMFPDPSDPNYVYAESQGGYIGRVNKITHETRDIQPKPDYQEKLRWNWNTPIALSPNEPGTIYIGSQFLFRSRDHGSSWERISPDLTTNDPNKQKQEESGGITVDNSSAEMHTTIYSISESPKDGKVIWVGTDDGNVQLTTDGGKSWNNVVKNVPNLPASSWVSWVQASNFDPKTAYVAFDRHSFGDLAPYVFKTTDAGAHWTPLVLPTDARSVRGYVHVIKEDVVDPQLLFLGTEFGLWISIDGGAQWAPFKGSRFPAVAVRDLAIQPRDNALVLATHGRGIWILDDITPLRDLSPALLQQDVAFVGTHPIQQRMQTWGGWANGAASWEGANPTDDAVITWYQRSRQMFGKVKLEILDPAGAVVETLPITTRRGLNRATWGMRLPPPHVPPAVQISGAGTQGPRALPGTYTVRLTENGKVSETKLEVGLDRRVTWTAADRAAQLDAMKRVIALFGAESDLFGRIAQLREDVAERTKAVGTNADLVGKLKALDDKLDALRKKIVATKEGGAITGEERLREHTDTLYGAIGNWEGPPTAYQLAYIDALSHELADLLASFEQIGSQDVPGMAAALKAAGQEGLVVPAKGSGDMEKDAPSGAGGPKGFDPDEPVEGATLPKGFRPY